MQKSSLHQVTEKQIHQVLQHALDTCHSLQRDLLDITRIENTKIEIQSHDNGLWNPIFFINIKNVDLVLKVSNPQWKNIKTLNEALIMKFLFEHVPDVCSPEIITFDNTGELIDGMEYILMRKCEGVALSDVYSNFSNEDRKFILKQIVQIRNAMSGISFVNSDNLEQQLFGCFQSIEMIDPEKKVARVTIGLNADKLGPFHSFEDMLCALIRNRYHQMENELDGKNKYLIPKFELFCNYLLQHKMELEPGAYTLVHTDLMPKNIIVDLDTKQITGLIDWEWAQLSIIDDDLSSLFDFCDNEEEKDYLIQGLKHSSNIDFDTIWKGFKSRELAVQIAMDSMCITCWPEWFTDKDEGEAYEKKRRAEMHERFERFSKESSLEI
jgi:serine/threonine protein kinase